MRTHVFEKWKWIPGWKGYYKISHPTLRVKSVTRVQNITDSLGRTYQRKLRAKILRQVPDPNGRPIVALGKRGRFKHFYVYRLYLLTFVGPCPPGMEACHKDDIKRNNYPENLYWGTRKQNMRDSIKNGGISAKVILNSKQRRKIKKRFKLLKKRHLSGPSHKFYGLYTKLAGEFNVSRMTIHRIVHGRASND